MKTEFRNLLLVGWLCGFTVGLALGLSIGLTHNIAKAEIEDNLVTVVVTNDIAKVFVFYTNEACIVQLFYNDSFITVKDNVDGNCLFFTDFDTFLLPNYQVGKPWKMVIVDKQNNQTIVQPKVIERFDLKVFLPLVSN